MRKAALVVVVLCALGLDAMAFGALYSATAMYEEFPWGVVFWLFMHGLVLGLVFLGHAAVSDACPALTRTEEEAGE